jgi:hypothetical protein
VTTRDAFRNRMLQRLPVDSLTPVELGSLLPELSFEPAELSRWTLLSASVEDEVGPRKHRLSRVYQISPTITLLIVETHLPASAQGAIAGGTSRFNGRPANLQSVVDADGRGAAAFAWSTDRMFYMLRLWVDDTDIQGLVEKIRHIAREVDACEKG